ncbi:hypothetical protein N7451_005032 [Penicillium sp. IBT 35674x]|nr:hypothetical protein N7451_005032 [Penicillium sp. IBT 35674x]
MLDDNRQRVLGWDETKALVKCYEVVLALITGKCKAVATTLNSSGEEALRISKFKPFALLCDEAGQCLEADTVIAMNWQSLRLTKYHGRSLMARLEWCYPLSTLEVNYRCYPDILACLDKGEEAYGCVGNLTIWNADSVKKASNGSARYLAGFLKDVMGKWDVLNWVGAETVERVVSFNLEQQMPASSPAPQLNTSPGRSA